MTFCAGAELWKGDDVSRDAAVRDGIGGFERRKRARQLVQTDSDIAAVRTRWRALKELSMFRC